MIRSLVAFSAVVAGFAPTQALAAPTFPLQFHGTMTDAGMGLFTGEITGDVLVNDPNGVPPFSGGIRLNFIIEGQVTTMDGTWSYSAGNFSCAVPDSEIDDALGPIMPPGTDVRNATCDGAWSAPCLRGNIYGNVYLFGIPLGNMVIANHTMCR